MISPDNDLNQAVYGIKATQLLTGQTMPVTKMPPSVRIVPRTHNRYSVRLEMATIMYYLARNKGLTLLFARPRMLRHVLASLFIN